MPQIDFDLNAPDHSEAPEPQTPDLSDSDISDARAMGWVPKEEFRGDETKWIDAPTFLQRGREITPLLRKNNEKLLKELRESRAELDELKLTVNEFRDMYQKMSDTAYKKAITDVKTQMRAAQRDGDYDLADQLQDQFEQLQEESKQATKVSTPQQAQNLEHQRKWEEHVSEWKIDNTWYEKDRILTRQMDSIAREIATQNPRLLGNPKLLDMALEQLKEEMPEKFSNTRRQNGSPVSGSSETASSGSRSRSPSARDLPAEAKAAGERFVKQGLFKDLNEYAKDYFSL